MAGRLQPLGDNIWFADGPVVSFYTFPYPTRMVVVRLGSGDLWLWSPIALDTGLSDEISHLGPVRHLVSPNALHHLYLSDWKSAFPDAQLWGPKETVRKRRDLRFDGMLGDQAPEAWAQEIDQVLFGGSPIMSEIVFFHRASRTAILADLSENFSDSFLQAHWSPWRRWIARRMRITEPWGWAPPEWRLSFIRRGQARAAAERILSWDPENVVVAHGPVQKGEGRAYLERALGWVLR